MPADAKGRRRTAEILCMDKPAASSIDDTVRILRPPPKVFTDERGRTVWMSGIAPFELALDADACRSTDPYNSGLASTSR